MLKEIRLQMVGEEDFGTIWNDGRPMNERELLAMAPAGDYPTDAGEFSLEMGRIEVFTRPSFKVVCCYDAYKRGRFFVETCPAVSEVPEKRLQTSLNDKRYVITDVLNHYARQNIFIVHVTEADQPQSWGKIVEIIAALTGWLPVYVGNESAGTSASKYANSGKALNMVGKTNSLLSVIALLQQARLFIGDSGAGLTSLARMLKTPVAVRSEVDEVRGDNAIEFSFPGFGELGKVTW